jgi:hypothetical protein
VPAPPPGSRFPRRKSSNRKRHAPKAPSRSDWEAAFAKVEAVPAKATEDTAAEFLPKFVAALREKGYIQGEVVARIMALKLGVTDRQIRDADKALRQSRTATPAAASLPAASAQTRPTAAPPLPISSAPSPGPRANGRQHAGFQTDEGLHRR